MDDLVSEFITETAEGLSAIDVELVNLEQNPNDSVILGGISRAFTPVDDARGVYHPVSQQSEIQAARST